MKNLLSITALAVSSFTLSGYQSVDNIAEESSEIEKESTNRIEASSAEDFIQQAEQRLFDFSTHASKIYWINATYITEDSDALAAKVGAEGTKMSVDFALQAAEFAKEEGLDPVIKRKLDILRGGIVLPAPTTAGAADELSKIATDLNSQYGKGKGVLRGKEINGSDIEAAMGTNRNPEELKEMWTSWHTNVGAHNSIITGRLRHPGSSSWGWSPS